MMHLVYSGYSFHFIWLQSCTNFKLAINLGWHVNEKAHHHTKYTFNLIQFIKMNFIINNNSVNFKWQLATHEKNKCFFGFLFFFFRSSISNDFIQSHYIRKNMFNTNSKWGFSVENDREKKKTKYGVVW